MNSNNALVPVTPMFTAPLGISAPSYVSLATSALDMTGQIFTYLITIFLNLDVNSINQNTNLSDYGGASTISDSMGILSTSTKSWGTFPLIRIQVL